MSSKYTARDSNPEPADSDAPLATGPDAEVLSFPAAAIARDTGQPGRRYQIGGAA